MISSIFFCAASSSSQREQDRKKENEMANRLGIASRIQSARVAANLTQAELAKALGFSRQRLGNYELGDRPIPLDVLRAVCEVLGVSADWLIWGTPSYRAFIV
jgi:DNA-binding XRE family transcriptional regulator